MTAALERRLAALEASRAGLHGPHRITAIAHRIVTPGCTDSPRVRAEFYGQVLHRHADEADDAFERRAVTAATAAAPSGAVACLNLFGAEPAVSTWDDA